jgi:IS30 family transposase
MKRRPRIKYTAQQRALMWERYSKGSSLNDIARLFERSHSSICGIIGGAGGIRPTDKKRAKCHLTLNEREEISRGISARLSMRYIAKNLNRPPSTVCREINRNGGYDKYRAVNADKAAWSRAERPKVCKLASNKKLALYVARKLKCAWSPQQIAGWLKRTQSNNEDFQVSHETIYKTLYIQTRGALKKELQKCLRSKRIMRYSRHASLKRKGHGKISDGVPIGERPDSVEDRVVPGHWEGDLIKGCNNTYIATLVERHSRYLMLVRVQDSKTKTVIEALIKNAKKLPSEMYKSLTWDRGYEVSNHKEFTRVTKIPLYLCDPYCPWQRGSNENTNRLIRQYFPKGTDLSIHSQQKLSSIARKLNERPRKILEYETPAEKFNLCVASID